MASMIYHSLCLSENLLLILKLSIEIPAKSTIIEKVSWVDILAIRKNK